MRKPLCFALFTLLALGSAVSQQLTEKPLRSAAVANAIGVCAHWDRPDSVFGTSGPEGHGDELASYLLDLGVTHYRTKAVDTPFSNGRILSLRAANHGHGPVADVIIDLRREIAAPLPPGTPHAVLGVNHTRVLLTGDEAKDAIAHLMKGLNDHIAGAIGYIEGPNEYDTSHHPVDTQWDTHLAEFMRIVDTEKSSQPNLKSLPLLPPSMGNFGHAQDEKSPLNFRNSGVQYQFANSHGYPRGLPPLNHMLGGASTAQTLAGPLPIFQTETGYANSLGGTGQPAVTESVAARYALRLVAEEMRTQVPGVAPGITPGIVLMNFYELSDEVVGSKHSDGAMGLIRLENAPRGKGTILKPKPIYFALQRFIHELKDEGARQDTLTYSLTSSNSDLHHLLLEKHDGTYVLLLWLEVPSAGIPASAIPVEVHLPSALQVTSMLDPVTGSRTTPTAAVSVSDSILMLQISRKAHL